MGPPESPTNNPQNQEATKRRCIRRRPRMRCCLLKGCGTRFHPRHASQRYCSDRCREAARKWSRWKAQGKYRATKAGKEKRNGQCRRYRKRVKRRKERELATADEAARVITTDFFRLFMRPARLLRDVRAQPEIAAATVLFEGVPAGFGARLGAGAAMERDSDIARPA
jgi:hypothetical protein